MKTDTLRYLFTTEEGSKERSPLSLCTHYALCAGSPLAQLLTWSVRVGADRRSRRRTFLRALRAGQGALCGCPGTSGLCVRFERLRCRMHPLLHYLRRPLLCAGTVRAATCAGRDGADMIRLHCKTMQNEREGKELSQYYLMLGMETCENIGAQNDDLYTMLVKSCAIFLHQIEEEAGRLLQVPTLPQSQASARHTSRTAGDIHAGLTGFGRPRSTAGQIRTTMAQAVEAGQVLLGAVQVRQVRERAAGVRRRYPQAARRPPPSTTPPYVAPFAFFFLCS